MKLLTQTHPDESNVLIKDNKHISYKLQSAGLDAQNKRPEILHTVCGMLTK